MSEFDTINKKFKDSDASVRELCETKDWTELLTLATLQELHQGEITATLYQALDRKLRYELQSNKYCLESFNDSGCKRKECELFHPFGTVAKEPVKEGNPGKSICSYYKIRMYKNLKSLSSATFIKIKEKREYDETIGSLKKKDIVLDYIWISGHLEESSFFFIGIISKDILRTILNMCLEPFLLVYDGPFSNTGLIKGILTISKEIYRFRSFEFKFNEFKHLICLKEMIPPHKYNLKQSRVEGRTIYYRIEPKK